MAYTSFKPTTLTFFVCVKRYFKFTYEMKYDKLCKQLKYEPKKKLTINVFE